MPKIEIEITNIFGEGICSQGFKVGDSFTYPDDRGTICPSALAVIRPYMLVLAYGGSLNPDDPDSISVSCPDAKHPVVYKIKRVPTT
ncbi:MAG: TIGR04076 family protein [Candidatus Heimdallarchaeota archaeon]